VTAPRHRKPPRIPTWLLFAGVAGVLTASAVLFVASRDQSHGPKPKPKDTSSATSSSDNTLILPKNGGDTSHSSDGGRTDLGKRRQADRSGSDTTDTTASTDAANDRSQLAALRGKRITLAPADAPIIASGTPKQAQRIGTRATTCGTTVLAAALPREREVLDALEAALTTAGADVVRLDDANGAVPCAAQRSVSFEKSDLGLMIAAHSAQSLASVALPSGKLPATDTERSRSFAQALDQATGAPVQLAPAGAAASVLLKHGVIELPAGGTSAWLALDSASDQLGADRLAGSIAAAMASTLG
jgi:hypothetical protein